MGIRFSEARFDRDFGFIGRGIVAQLAPGGGEEDQMLQLQGKLCMMLWVNWQTESDFVPKGNSYLPILMWKEGQTMVSITEVMSKELKIIPWGASVADTAQKMRDEKVGALFIEKNGELVGSVTDRELVRRAVADRKDLENYRVESIMTTPLNIVESTETLLDAQDKMRDLGVRHLAVREEGKVVGIISVGDLLAYFTWRA